VGFSATGSIAGQIPGNLTAFRPNYTIPGQQQVQAAQQSQAAFPGNATGVDLSKKSSSAAKVICIE